jgi:hypothetical protein
VTMFDRTSWFTRVKRRDHPKSVQSPKYKDFHEGFTKSAEDPRFHENITLPKPRLFENEPTLGSWPVLVMWFGGASQVYIDV